MKWFAVVLCICLAIPLLAQEKETQRLQDSYDVLKAVTGMPDTGIPTDLLNKAECVIVVPAVKKAAFIVGASYGRELHRPGLLAQGRASPPLRLAVGLGIKHPRG